MTVIHFTAVKIQFSSKQIKDNIKNNNGFKHLKIISAVFLFYSKKLFEVRKFR